LATDGHDHSGGDSACAEGRPLSCAFAGSVNSITEIPDG
jgi:hypothetical protein